MTEKYKQLPYIQSSGNQYINTGLRISSGRIKFEIQYEYVSIPSGEGNMLGSFYNWPSSSGLFAFGIDGQQRSVVSSGRNFRSVSAASAQVGTIYTAIVDISSSGQSVMLNGTAYSGDGYTVGSAESIYIFCNGAEVQHFAAAKIYYLKIWDDNTLIADYIPAVDTEEGVGGLYNTLDDTFLKSGNGDFEYTTWAIKDDSLSNIFSIPLPTPGTPPAAMWRVDSAHNNGFPYNGLLIGISAEEISGAFMNAAQLRYVSIPRTCQVIGEWAFTNTALKSVMVPEDCEYADTSFPPDCEVGFYGGGGDYGQLYDGDGCAVLDGDGARIFIGE